MPPSFAGSQPKSLRPLQNATTHHGAGQRAAGRKPPQREKTGIRVELLPGPAQSELHHFFMNTTNALDRREFLRRATIAAAGVALCPQLAPAAPPTDVPAERLARLATGANVCRWFRSPRRDSPEHFSNYIPETEAALIARMGIKHVRLCVAPRVVMDAATGALREDRPRPLRGRGAPPLQ